jgi:Ca-activated chloride channel homolog
MNQTLLTKLSCLAGLALGAAHAAGKAPPKVTEGSLLLLNGDGQAREFCPLKQTNVKAEISGPLARVTVMQQFENPSNEKIEAVYTFPLPHDAAVDDMTLKIGDRVVRGLIKRKEEARQIYDAARRQGRLAGLLDQERPNIFVQSVTNIPPGAKVLVTIRYIETVPYEAGAYNFVFPIVVGPRYNPAGTPNHNPPVAAKGTRAGHDITLDVNLDAGVPLQAVASSTHEIDVVRSGHSRASARLKNAAVIPNKDFELKYAVAGEKIQDAILSHSDSRGGFFTMILQPPNRVRPAEVAPKELVFVIDTSGSMHGYPLDKVKETMKLAFEGLNPRDTFNLITFSGDEHILFEKPVPATPENLKTAWEFLKSRSGRGGTEMMKAIRAALDPSDRQEHVRIACFMTDGYVGNDMEIIAEVKKHPNARVFAFGIGNSVNRYLLDGMAKYGRGEVEYVALNADGSAAAKRFHERVQNPLLTDITIEWNGLPVSDVLPARLPDLFSAKPLVITGRYRGVPSGSIRLKGNLGGKLFSRDIPVKFASAGPNHEALATLWARTKVTDLMSQDLAGIQRGAASSELKEAITRLGLDYRLMTQFTSFVAVEESVVTEGGAPRVIQVPVEMPEGVSHEGVFGQKTAMSLAAGPVPMAHHAPRSAGITADLSRHREAEVKAVPNEIHKIDSALRGRQPGTVLEVEIQLNDVSAATLAKLKALGVTLLTQPNQARTCIAKLDSVNLLRVARLAEVRFIAPSRA